MSRSRAALDLLDGLPRFATSGATAVKPGLERILRLLDLLDNPHLSCPTVHVAGTNGKGSTASFVAAIATASGIRTGLHTSPHLVSVTERMRIDGKPVPRAWLEEAVGRLEPAIRRIGPSYFEATVALSFAWFAEQHAELAVVEVGLGGRLDATNVVDPSVCIITDIGLDHRDLLGDTVEAIAGEKAGIMKFGTPVIVADSGPSVENVFRKAAEAAGSPLHLLRSEMRIEPVDDRVTFTSPVARYERLPLGLPGPVQARNAALAIRAAELLGTHLAPYAPLSADAVRAGLADVTCLSGLRGRMETLLSAPRVMADVAHNPDGVAAALAAFPRPGPDGRAFVLLSLMADKPVDDIVRQVVGTGAAVVPVVLEAERALPARGLAEAVRSAGGHCLEPIAAGPAGVPDWVRTHARPHDAVLILGSHLLVGGVLEAWS